MKPLDIAGLGKVGVSDVFDSARIAGNVVYLPVTTGGSAREEDVERINQFSFYQLGKVFGVLERLEGVVQPRTAFFPIISASGTATTLLSGDPISLGVSRIRAEAFSGQLSVITERYLSKVDENGKRSLAYPKEDAEPIPEWELNWLKRTLSNFETVFSDEMSQAATYFVPRRGIYSTPELIDNADQTFPKELLPHIPEKTRDDWKSAGRCLAFSLLTATGFHVARAVEGTVESYYQLFSGKPEETLRSWDDYVKALRKIAEKKPTPAPQEKTLTELDQMRTDYRNPLVHPRVVLSEGDARMLYANGESLIIAMAQEIAAARKGVQPALALIGGKNDGGQEQAG